MPRIRQNEAEYRKADFMEAIRKAQAKANKMRMKTVAEDAGINYSTFWKRMQNPDDITLGELRSILKSIPLTATSILAFLGFPKREINQYTEVQS